MAKRRQASSIMRESVVKGRLLEKLEELLWKHSNVSRLLDITGVHGRMAREQVLSFLELCEKYVKEDPRVVWVVKDPYRSLIPMAPSLRRLRNLTLSTSTPVERRPFQTCTQSYRRDPFGDHDPAFDGYPRALRPELLDHSFPRDFAVEESDDDGGNNDEGQWDLQDAVQDEEGRPWLLSLLTSLYSHVREDNGDSIFQHYVHVMRSILRQCPEAMCWGQRPILDDLSPAGIRDLAFALKSQMSVRERLDIIDTLGSCLYLMKGCISDGTLEWQVFDVLLQETRLVKSDLDRLASDIEHEIFKLGRNSSKQKSGQGGVRYEIVMLQPDSEVARRLSQKAQRLKRR